MQSAMAAMITLLLHNNCVAHKSHEQFRTVFGYAVLCLCPSLGCTFEWNASAGTRSLHICPCRLPGLEFAHRGGGSLPGRMWKRHRATGVFDVDLCRSWEAVEDEGARIALLVEQNKKYMEAFRMNVDTFERLCRKVVPLVEKETTRFRNDTVPARKRVAIGVMYLAHSQTYISLGWTHGLGKSTVRGICREVIAAICTLASEYISFPQGVRLQRVMQDFQSLKDGTGLPQCAGAVDGTHVSIQKPRLHGEAYFNRKSQYSIVLQACVDAHGLFTDVNIGWPGRVHDARIWKQSSLYDRALKGTILRDVGPAMVEGVEVWPYLCGDAAYGATSFMVPPFKGQNLPPAMDWFNYRQSGTRIAVEKAFGRLKGRFQSLRSQLRYASIPEICLHIQACCILHNFLEMQGAAYDESMTAREDHAQPLGRVGNREAVERELAEAGQELRDTLCQAMERLMPDGYIRRQNFYMPA